LDKNDNKVYDLIQKMYTEFTQRFENIENELSKIKIELISFRKETNSRFDTLENKLEDIEVHNANRHVSISADIKDLQFTQSKMEIVTADN